MTKTKRPPKAVRFRNAKAHRTASEEGAEGRFSAQLKNAKYYCIASAAGMAERFSAKLKEVPRCLLRGVLHEYQSSK